MIDVGCTECGECVDASKVKNSRISGKSTGEWAWAHSGPDVPDGLRWRERVCKCGNHYYTIELTVRSLENILQGLNDTHEIDIKDLNELLSFEPE